MIDLLMLEMKTVGTRIEQKQEQPDRVNLLFSLILLLLLFVGNKNILGIDIPDIASAPHEILRRIPLPSNCRERHGQTTFFQKISREEYLFSRSRSYCHELSRSRIRSTFILFHKFKRTLF